MELKKIIAPILVSVILVSTPVFADSEKEDQNPANLLPQMTVTNEDPINMLQNLDIIVQQAIKEGRVSEDAGPYYSYMVNMKMGEIQIFNSFELDQKKDWLKQDVTGWLNGLTNVGIINSFDSAELLSQYMAEINSWDGIGYPDFYIEKVEAFTDSILAFVDSETNTISSLLPDEKMVDNDPVEMLKDLESKVQQAVKEETISEERALDIYSTIHSKMGELQNYAGMELDLKKHWLTHDITTWINNLSSIGAANSFGSMNLLKKYTATIDSWDGQGYPNFYLMKTKTYVDSILMLLGN